MLHSICQQIWKTQQWPQDWKGSVFIPIPKKGNAKECSNSSTTALIWHVSKAKLKILQARLQHYVNCELPDVQAGFRKGRGTRDQITNICWIIENAREFQKNIYFYFIDYGKAFYCVDHHRASQVALVIKKLPANVEDKRDLGLIPLSGRSLKRGMATTNWEFFKIWEYQTILTASWEACMQDKKQHLQPDMEQWTVSKLGKE